MIPPVSKPLYFQLACSTAWCSDAAKPGDQMDPCQINPPKKAHRIKQRLCPEANRLEQIGKNSKFGCECFKSLHCGSKEERPNTRCAPLSLGEQGAALRFYSSRLKKVITQLENLQERFTATVPPAWCCQGNAATEHRAGPAAAVSILE